MIKRYETFNSIELRKEPAIFTGNSTLDAWWSADGGIVVGSAIFLTGTSGSGKTTLSVFLAKLLNDHTTMIYSREMNRRQLKQQTKRLDINHDNLLIADVETCPSFDQFMEVLDETKPKFVIVDSLQVVSMEDFSNDNQEKAQYDIIKNLRNWVAENGSVLFVIGHNTKEGEFRGANTNMQMFDAHLEMIHHKKDDTRTMAWGQKNRKGPLKKLYYEFTKDSMTFYTEEEWKDKGKEFSVVDELKKVQIKIFDMVEKQGKEKAKNFEKNLNKEMENIDFSGMDKVEEYMKIISISQKIYHNLFS